MLGEMYSGCVHVEDVGLRGATDQRIWDYCREEDLILVSKDTDFRERSLQEGFPPKVIWLDVGNAGTEVIASLLRRSIDHIAAFDGQKQSSFLALRL